MNHHVAKILQELFFFLALVAVSECLRRLVKRARPDSRVAEALQICSLVLGWYSVSITLVLLNKWVMTSWEGGLPFPLFYTMSHMVLKGCFALLYLLATCQPLQVPSSGPCCGASIVGLMTALDVAASNMSFLFITVAFYTMLKSASLIFILVFGLILRMEQCSFGIAGTVLLIAFGIFITSYGETDFDATGFWLVLSSEVFAAMRWLATQKTLHSSGLSAMQTVLFMSPASSVTLAPIVAVRERHKLTFLADPYEFLQYLLLVLVPGFLAFLLLLIEVQLVKVTSSLTLSVFGNLKSVVTIIFSIVVFGEKTTMLQWSGLLLALTGMLVYARLKNSPSLAVDSLALVRYEALPQEDDADSPKTRGNGCGEIDVQMQDEPKVPAPSMLGVKTTPAEEQPQGPQ